MTVFQVRELLLDGYGPGCPVRVRHKGRMYNLAGSRLDAGVVILGLGVIPLAGKKKGKGKKKK
jgi:hypothetical protein